MLSFYCINHKLLLFFCIAYEDIQFPGYFLLHHLTSSAMSYLLMLSAFLSLDVGWYEYMLILVVGLNLVNFLFCLFEVRK